MRVGVLANKRTAGFDDSWQSDQASELGLAPVRSAVPTMQPSAHRLSALDPMKPSLGCGRAYQLMCFAREVQ